MIEPTSTAIAVTAAFATGAAKKAGEIAFDRLMQSISTLIYADRDASLTKQMSQSLEKYERHTFERCIKIKTLITRDTPVDLLSIYVPVRFKTGDKSVDQYDLIRAIPNLKNVAISGTGGSGKSMFMRYLWLSLFEDGSGRIPIFLELRNYNDISLDDFGIYLFNSIFSGVDNAMGLKSFSKMLDKGLFSFIFDGFDEVSEERKYGLSKQILALSDRYPDNLYIVSTRPLDSVVGWPTFSTYHVSPMTKNDVISLISKTEFAPKVKSKFLSAVKGHLFDSHKSFLEIPLLVNIMLLLFDDIADIPKDMHVFYEQAFWTLFRRHDASKEAFDRKLNCGLTMDDFKSAVAAFCFFSYIANKPSLSDIDINKYSQQAANLININFKGDLFKKDLVNNICFLQLDGIEYSFIHRSFQEYFVAVFISDRPENEWLEASLMLPNSNSESALKILYSINSDKFNHAIIYNLIDSLSLSEMSETALFQRIIELEGNVFEISVIPSSLKGKISGSRPIIYASTMRSKIARLLVYYFHTCLNKKNITITYAVRSYVKSSSTALYKIIYNNRKLSKSLIDHEYYYYGDIRIGHLTSIDTIQCYPPILELSEADRSELVALCIEVPPYSRFKRSVKALCTELATIAAQRSAKKPFSALIGRAPIFS